MQVIVLADDVGKEEFMTKQLQADNPVYFAENFQAMMKAPGADVFFILKEGIVIREPEAFNGKPVILHSTIHTLKEHKLPANFSRVNGWPTFVKREMWEVATNNEDLVKNTFEKLNLQWIMVADEPGLVSARIISMIINEAYYALGENVSSKDEIDLAMKLGTNYPYGPFEWSKKIGLQNVYRLLEKLSVTDSRYTIAAAMKNEMEKI